MWDRIPALAQGGRKNKSEPHHMAKPNLNEVCKMGNVAAKKLATPFWTNLIVEPAYLLSFVEFFGQYVHIKLALPQAAWLSILLLENQ